MIVIIGFKHVGKTTLGKTLAEKMNLPFHDLDQIISAEHNQTCRELLENLGEQKFRELETTALKKALQSEGILALGGGAVLEPENQKLLKNHTVIHLTADKDRVFEWILANGRPSFFPAGDDRAVFEELWAIRMPVYSSLAKMEVRNNENYDSLALEIIAKLK